MLLPRGWTRFRLPVLLLAACAGTGPELPPHDNDLRLLFIGNSLTYTNDLPAMIRQLGLAVGGKTPVVESVAIPDFSLEDHWNRGDAQQAIRRDKWDFVVLQQGPSALPESRVLLVEYTRKFAEEIRAVGGRPALYMVWPPASRAPEWDQVTESYVAAAREVNGVVFPVGEAFRAARRRDPGLALLGGDGFHPSVAGTYLAALVIYAQVSQRSPIGMSSAARIVSLPTGEIDALEQGAAEAIAQFSSP
jgi:hypothetical protein